MSIEEVMLKDLKEISDGEIKVAISTVYMALEVRESLKHVKQRYCIWRWFFKMACEQVSIFSQIFFSMSRIFSVLINFERSSSYFYLPYIVMMLWLFPPFRFNHGVFKTMA